MNDRNLRIAIELLIEARAIDPTMVLSKMKEYQHRLMQKKELHTLDALAVARLISALGSASRSVEERGFTFHSAK